MMKHILQVLVLMVCIFAIGCGGKSDGGDSAEGVQTSQYAETAALKEVASETESAFLSGNTESVLALMSDEVKDKYQGDLEAYQEQLAGFGNDFKLG